MAPIKRKYRTIYVVTAALMVAMIGGYALAATTLTTLSPGQTSNVTSTPSPTGFTAGTISSEQLVVLSTNMVAVATAGTQIGTVGLAGTPTGLAVCAASPCTAQNFRPVTPASETIGNYGEQIVISVVQPATGGTSQGFDFSITIIASTGTTVAQGYLATSVSTSATSVAVPVFVFVDLGTTTAPTINSLSVVFNQCSSATSCP